MIAEHIGMNRRWSLKLAGGPGTLTTLSGCSGLSRAIPGCSRTERTSISFEAVEWTEDSAAEKHSQILPFEYQGLVTAFPDVFTDINAFDSWHYEQCPPIPEYVQSFVTLTRNRIVRQFDQYEGDISNAPTMLLESAYVVRDGTYKKLFLYHQGELVSGDTLVNESSNSSKASPREK